MQSCCNHEVLRFPLSAYLELSGTPGSVKEGDANASHPRYEREMLLRSSQPFLALLAILMSASGAKAEAGPP